MPGAQCRGSPSRTVGPAAIPEVRDCARVQEAEGPAMGAADHPGENLSTNDLTPFPGKRRLCPAHATSPSTSLLQGSSVSSDPVPQRSKELLLIESSPAVKESGHWPREWLPDRFPTSAGR